jgi:hypothetical protein
MVFEAPQPVAAITEVVEILELDFAFELLIVRKPAIGGQQEEIRQNALYVAVLPQKLF